MLSGLFGKKERRGVQTDLMVGWKAQQKAQLSNRRTADFFPVPEAYLEKFNGPGEADLNSIAFAGSFQGLQHLMLTVLPLRHLIKELAVHDRGSWHACPSVAIDDACHQLQDIMDGTINEIPSRLLLYLTSLWSDIDLFSSKEQNLLRLRKIIDDNYLHSYHLVHAKLTLEYINGLTGVVYSTFSSALGRLSDIGLMLNDQMCPLAMDAFPSLATRKNDIEQLYHLMRREAAAPEV